MAEKLMKYYQYASEKGGLSLKMALAQETKLPSTMAALQPDSLENIQKLRAALKKLTGTEPPNYN